ncbi:MAG: BACON domain-containing protein [Alistipes sp.]|nr:BACON domain-containing protein [Alistipes sp.]
MTKRFFAFFATIAILLTACEPANTDPTGGNEPGNTTPSLTITSASEVNVGYGNAVSVIVYTLNNPTEEYKVEAAADVEWINSFDHSKMGNIKFTVDENSSYDARQGIITVSYADVDYTVTVNQEGTPRPEEHNIEAPFLLGHYYGDYAGNNYNYYVCLSESDYDANTSFYDAGFKFFLDVYSDQRPADYDHIKIPNGVYTFNINNDGTAGTFLECASLYKEYDSTGFEINQRLYLDGTLTVTDDEVKFEVTFEDPEDTSIYVVTFSGDYSMVDYRYMSGGIY